MGIGMYAQQQAVAGVDETDLDISSLPEVTEWCYSASGKDAIAVGLITKPMFTLSAINAFRESVKKALTDMGYARVEVTTDADLYYAISKQGKQGTAEQVERLCDMAQKRR